MYGWEGRGLVYCIAVIGWGNCRASMVSLQSPGQTFKQDRRSLVDFLLSQESNSSTLGDFRIVWLGPLDFLGQIPFKASERWPLVTSIKSFHGNIQVCGMKNNWCQESCPVASTPQPFRSAVHECMQHGNYSGFTRVCGAMGKRSCNSKFWRQTMRQCIEYSVHVKGCLFKYGQLRFHVRPLREVITEGWENREALRIFPALLRHISDMIYKE